MNPPTPRQLEIMAAVLRTGSAKIAAAELGIAYSTVKNQQTALFKRLGVTNRCEACAAIYGERDADLARRIEARVKALTWWSRPMPPTPYLDRNAVLAIIREEAGL